MPITRYDLRQIYHLKNEIILYESELDEKRKKSLAKGQKLTGMPNGYGTTSDSVAAMAIDLADTTRILEGRIIELRKKEAEIFNFISTIPDSWMRQIVYMRNINCLNWNVIARKLGGNNTAGSVSKSYYRFLDSMFGEDKAKPKRKSKLSKMSN